jgi:hypothetical protein
LPSAKVVGTKSVTNTSKTIGKRIFFISSSPQD